MFNGHRAYKDVLAQVAFGPRVPGSEASEEEINFITNSLHKAGWLVKYQNTYWKGFHILNIIGYREGNDNYPKILLGAHYDSRIVADRDTDNSILASVPGANDGASGVAVLLELARTLPEDGISVWLVFFDAEDNAALGGREGLMGSTAFVSSLDSYPSYVIIVDMVGDADLNIFMEVNSDPRLSKEIWNTAKSLGYEQFIPEIKYSISDDHIPFIDKGIATIDIIDFDYPYWHRSSDTPDKVSPESLFIVGNTIWTWIAEK